MRKNFKTVYFEELRDDYNGKSPKVSFEFFPPKTEEMDEKLWNTITELVPLSPDFVSVTYGAGGSTREKTRSTLQKIVKNTPLKAAAHLTCVGANRNDINEIAENYWNEGVRHIVALRGDLPGFEGVYKPYPDGYAYADDLVKGLKEINDFEISVAAYPETHPQALSDEKDIEHLKRKFDAGADRAITQFFFDAETYLKFLEKTQAAGIEGKIVPGIINLLSYEQIVRFAGMCESTIPKWMHEILEPIKDDPEATKEASIQISAKLCLDLMSQGVDQFHFYSMNRSDLTKDVCSLINIFPK